MHNLSAKDLSNGNELHHYYVCLFYALGNNCHVQCPNVRGDVGFVQWNDVIVHGIAMSMCFK